MQKMNYEDFLKHLKFELLQNIEDITPTDIVCTSDKLIFHSKNQFKCPLEFKLNQLYKQYSNVCIGNRVPAVYRIGERKHFLSLSYISHTDNVIAFRKEPCPSFIYGSFGFVRLLFLYTCSLRR